MENPWINLENDMDHHPETLLDISNWPHLHGSRSASLGSLSENSSENSSNSSESSRSASCSRKEKELDPSILERRQKQIDYGKNLLDYDTYVSKVSKNQRPLLNFPRTPNKNVKYSRRQWDGLIKKWKIKIHALNPENNVLEHHDDVFIAPQKNEQGLEIIQNSVKLTMSRRYAKSKEKAPKSTNLTTFDKENEGRDVENKSNTNGEGAREEQTTNGFNGAAGAMEDDNSKGSDSSFDENKPPKHPTGDPNALPPMKDPMLVSPMKSGLPPRVPGLSHDNTNNSTNDGMDIE